MASKQRKRPLTAKVRRGLAQIVPLVRVNLENGEGDLFSDGVKPDDVESALAWIEQFAADRG